MCVLQGVVFKVFIPYLFYSVFVVMERTKVGRKHPMFLKFSHSLQLFNVYSFQQKVFIIDQQLQLLSSVVLASPKNYFISIQHGPCTQKEFLATKPNAEFGDCCKHVKPKLFIYLCMHDINFVLLFYYLYWRLLPLPMISCCKTLLCYPAAG